MIALTLACASLTAGHSPSPPPVTLSCRKVGNEVEISVEAGSDTALNATYKLVVRNGSNTVNQSGHATLKPHERRQLAVVRTNTGAGGAQLTLDVSPDGGQPYTLSGSWPPAE